MIASRRLLFLVVAVSASVSSPAIAQNQAGAPEVSTENRALAEMLFFTARGLMEAGRYSEACAKLAESFRLDPAAGTLLNLAVCHEKEGKIASAWGEFKQAVTDARKANRPDREQLANEHATTLEPDLPYLTITVPDAVKKIPGLVITRNGLPLNPAAWNTELPVDPGTVEIEERAPAYKPKKLKVTIANKEHSTFTVEALELAPVYHPPPPFWTTKRTVGGVLLAAGVVAAGFGTYFGVSAINHASSSNSNCPNDAAGQQRCTQTGVNDMSTARTAAWISDFTIGAGAISAVVGTYLLVTGGVHEQSATPAPPPAAAGNWSFRPSAGPTSAGAVISRSF